MSRKINVTKTHLPDFKDYIKLLEGVWERGWITNNGTLLNELEKKLRNYLNSNSVFITNNGTMALQLAIRALDLNGKEVITTPFSYVATINALLWEGAIPIMVDINPKSYNINIEKIEEKITSKTGAILPVHVYGFPCPTREIGELARNYNLNVIYDAAQAFGTSLNGRHLSDFGDLVCYSFHATKPFHTIEGGAIVVNNESLNEKIDLMRHFGHRDDEYFMLGVNAKMSEFHAAMGHLMLDRFDNLVSLRKNNWEYYQSKLFNYSDNHGLPINPDVSYNYAYYPILLRDDLHTLRIISMLNAKNIFPRRYFYPALNKLPFFKGNYCKIAEDISNRILCLPLSHDLEKSVIDDIVEVIMSS